MTNTLKDLEFSEFKELVLFLKQNETEFYPILKKLERFFPTLTASEAVILGNIINYILVDDADAENVYNSFKSENGDLEVDPTGKSESKEINYSTIPLNIVETIYNSSLSKSDSISKQIKHAKLLDCFNDITSGDYYMKRSLYYKRTETVISLDEMKSLESELKEITDNTLVILGKLIDYISSKKIKECEHFMKHFIIRVHACYMDKNYEMKENKEFLERLKAL